MIRAAMVIAVAACLLLDRAAASKGAAADRGRDVARMFGMPARANGECPRGAVRAPKLGRLCYRSCAADGDCPRDATCRALRGVTGTKFCFAQAY